MVSMLKKYVYASLIKILKGGWESSISFYNCMLFQLTHNSRNVNIVITFVCAYRHSTPLHFAAGYNRVSVVEYLLAHGADVHSKDKG